MEPNPHYCAHPAGEGDRAGCPLWPACLGAPAATAAGPPGIGQSLASLAGFAAAAVIFLAVVAVLLPLFV